jgi:hypothetical protein
MTDHWEYFNWPEILSEARARLAQARAHDQNSAERDTLEYWCAWCAHANAAACINADR